MGYRFLSEGYQQDPTGRIRLDTVVSIRRSISLISTVKPHFGTIVHVLLGSRNFQGPWDLSRGWERSLIRCRRCGRESEQAHHGSPLEDKVNLSFRYRLIHCLNFIPADPMESGGTIPQNLYSQVQSWGWRCCCWSHCSSLSETVESRCRRKTLRVVASSFGESSGWRIKEKIHRGRIVDESISDRRRSRVRRGELRLSAACFLMIAVQSRFVDPQRNFLTTGSERGGRWRSLSSHKKP